MKSGETGPRWGQGKLGQDPDQPERRWSGGEPGPGGRLRAGPLKAQSSRGRCTNHRVLPPPLSLDPQLALNIGNTRFNEVMEAQLPSHGGPKPSAESDM